MCFTLISISLFSALKLLLESGVDVNMQDDFSSVHRVARQKRYDPNAGTYTHTCAHRNTHTHAHTVLLFML